MKAVFRITLLIAALTWTSLTALQAQRIIKGSVYREGEPAAGVTVEAHRGGTMMTSFDGKYEVEAHENTKWLKFTFINESHKLDISDKTGDNFDFAFEVLVARFPVVLLDLVLGAQIHLGKGEGLILVAEILPF